MKVLQLLDYTSLSQRCQTHRRLHRKWEVHLKTSHELPSESIAFHSVTYLLKMVLTLSLLFDAICVNKKIIRSASIDAICVKYKKK